MAKPILISGIQPSGKLHIGNYLGALKNFVALQSSGKYQCYFFIADLHALIENPDPSALRERIFDLAASFLAAGIDPKKSVVFLQSQVSAHQELAQILSTLVPVSELMRMTQFKDKVIQPLNLPAGKKASQKEFDEVVERTNFGLAYYPVLMAADILLYSPKFVPVGDDQLQHLELTRTLARKFNSRFGKTFAEPQPILTETPRVMSLDDPTKKMSKSRPQGCIFLDDSPEEIKNKVKRATTDSESEIRYDAERKPGVSNLLRIYAALSDKFVPDLEKNFSEMNYGEFKIGLGNTIASYFAPFREKKRKAMKNQKALAALLATGGKKAGKVAAKKILEVKKRVGIAL